MRITHFGHSCVLLDNGSTRLLIDPGGLSSGFENLTELTAILITHQHFDHLNVEALPELLAANPQVELIVDSGTAEAHDKLVSSARVVRPGETLEFGSTSIHVVGGQHAIIHPEIPVIRNCGYVVDHGAFYHPGDSLFVPEQRIDVLGLPTGAPWLKSAEAIDFLRIVKPRVATPIHQATLATPHIWYRQFQNLAPQATKVEVLPESEAVEL